MKAPKFLPSNRFLDELNVPCFIAELRNSKLPKIGTRHIAEYKDDPECRIYLRGKNAHTISKWHQEIIHDLFEQENLAAAVNEAMNEYLTSDNWGGKDGAEISDEDREPVRKHGFASYLTISDIIVDEIARKVILCANTIVDGNLNEHGICIFLRNKRWRFETSEYYASYFDSIGGAAAPTKDESIKQGWERLFPTPEVGASVKKDPGLMIGRWALDEPESKKLLKKLKVRPDDIADLISKLDDTGLEFTKTAHQKFSLTSPYRYYDGQHLPGYERRGNRILVRIPWGDVAAKGEHPETCGYWCDGKRLVSERGMVYRKTRKVPTVRPNLDGMDPLSVLSELCPSMAKMLKQSLKPAKKRRNS